MENEKNQENNKEKKEYVFFVNKKEIQVSQEDLTGKEILSLAGYDVNQYDLFLIHGQQSEQIKPDQSIKISNGMHFNAILKSAPYG